MVGDDFSDNAVMLSGQELLSVDHVEPDVLPPNDPSLSDIRKIWKNLLDQPLIHGQSVHVISRAFVKKVLTQDAENVNDLAKVVGPITFFDHLNKDCDLKQEGQEPELMGVSLNTFKELDGYFGHVGTPTIRSMIENSDGVLVLEMFPPNFVIHTINKNSHNTRHNPNNDRYSSFQRKQSVSISSAKTIADLYGAIEIALHRERLGKFRLWLIAGDDLESLPAHISPHQFVYLGVGKKLVGPEVMSRTLFVEGITSSFHVVAEPSVSSEGKYALDNYLGTVDPSSFDVETLFKSGGNLGLSNLGNTCYMNSALQCLVHIPELNNYFLLDLFKNDLNKLNPLGCNGEIAATFSGLLHKLFDESSGSQGSVTPRDFKFTIGRHSSMFRGYQQQDSQEFTSWLLDTLHEDLNRIHKKPYLEKPELKDEDINSADALRAVAETCWKQHKMRNDSVVVDLFTGLYQSTLVCPTCQKKSVTFDPFNDLTLPLPQSVKWYHTFSIIDLRTGENHIPLLTLEVELNKTSNFDDLIEYLSRFLQVEPRFLFLFEIFREFFYKDFQEDSNLNKFLPISELISSADNVCVYIIPHDAKQDMILPIINVVKNEDASYNLSEPFAFPAFIVLNKETEVGDFDIIEKKVEEAASLFTRKQLDITIQSVSTELYDEIEIEEATEASEHSELEKNKAGKSEKVPTASGTEKTGVADSPTSDTFVSNVVNPFDGASPRYAIRVHEDNGKFNFKARFKSSYKTSGEDSSLIHLPQTRPHFERLPLLKDTVEKIRLQVNFQLSAASAPGSNTQSKDSDTLLITSDDEGSDFVLIDNELKSDLCKNPPTISDLGSEVPESTSSSLEVHSDSNWDNVDSLFTSGDNLGHLTNETEVIADLEQTSDNEKTAIVTRRLCLVVDWDCSAYNEYFNDDVRTWENLDLLPNPELEENRRRNILQQKSSISLLECLRNFSSPEVLGEQDLWYCPRCKDHKRATKTIQVWSTGDILTIHLKRFQTSRSFSDKLNMVVDFPIEGLDISEFVTAKTDDGDLTYDLIAVDNHYGGLGGGHYTAAAKNFRDGQWYYFDDSRVSRIDDPKLTITSAAYLLFYRKRSSKPFVGGENVERLLSEGRQQLSEKLQKSKEQVIDVMQCIETFRKQDSASIPASDSDLLNLSDSCAKLNFKSLDDEDLYSDPDSPSGGPSIQKVGSKNLRSPATAQNSAFEFENQRKQRLISKDCDEPRSVNINMGQSTSGLNLASPEVSDEDDMALGG